jgi:hypothetical protein
MSQMHFSSPRAFADYGRFQVDAATSDETLVRNAASQVARPEDETREGNILVDFPANVKQAQQLAHQELSLSNVGWMI